MRKTDKFQFADEKALDFLVDLISRESSNPSASYQKISFIALAFTTKPRHAFSMPRFSFNVNYALMYLVIFDWPIFLICPSFTILLSTASTVVGLTSGNIPQISAFEIGTKLFRTVASILAVFVIFLP